MTRYIDHHMDDWDRFDAEIDNQTFRPRHSTAKMIVAILVSVAIVGGAGLWAVGFFMGVFQRPASLEAEAVIDHQVKMGMSPEVVGQLYSSLSMGMPDRKGRTGSFQLDGVLHTVWFATEQGNEQVWRVHFKRAYGNTAEAEVLDRFTAVYGRPDYRSCATPLAQGGHECHLRWRMADGVMLDIFSQGEVVNRRPLTQIAVVATDTQRATRRFGAQIPPASADPAPPASAEPPAAPVKAAPAVRNGDSAPRGERPIDQFFSGLKRR